MEHELDRFAWLAMMKFPIFAALILAGCSDHRPPRPTEQQSDQLNDAENMLNAAQNEEGPADRSASPSNPSR